MEYQSALYKVTVTEYDHGVQRIDPQDTKIFTTREEAEAYKALWTAGDAGCYWRAEIESL
jgi:hypothetical protein